ncbi:RloB family protein [Actinomyces glycerinitolerans]|uniref:RloB domain-containing protein n=1 Tax=Actinomyces glycerinitolerans TaxID=1892869 RepID=A0A1M4RZW4_9ACTO|nr:RloB family protein [Actinomyces glycerinitolerans]SHE25471.1 Hypothetical protein ACGLYG10_1687 [Actinomyces glycerinitolerans]
MGRTIQRNRRNARRTRTTVLIITNGARTEKEYLEVIKKKVPRDAGLAITLRPEDGKEPETILKDLTGVRGGLTDFDEVWIVVDHDGTDRKRFLKDCAGLKSSRVVGVVSVPCFEVWLIAHYERVRRYQDQTDAQRHYRQLTGQDGRDAKGLPKDFPFDRVDEAAQRCFIVGDSAPQLNTQGSSPSTTMPHLLRRLGLLDR